MKYAVIEITMGGVELLIAEAGADKQPAEILKDRKACSLFSYIKDKRLSERGMEKLAESVNAHKAVCAAQGAEIYPIVLRAIRLVKNFDEVIDHIRFNTGLSFVFLKKSVCAYCDSLAAGEFAGQKGLVLIDTGSGSTQLADMGGTGESGDLYYSGIGSARLSARFSGDSVPGEKEIKKMKAYIKSKFAADFFRRKFERAVLIGGISAAVAKIYADYFQVSLDEAFTVERKKLQVLFEFLLSDSNNSALVLKHAPERVNTITESVLIIKELLKKFDIDAAVYRPYGIIDGYMRGIIGGLFQKETRKISGKTVKSKSKQPRSEKEKKEKPVKKTALGNSGIKAKPETSKTEKPAPKSAAANKEPAEKELKTAPKTVKSKPAATAVKPAEPKKPAVKAAAVAKTSNPPQAPTRKNAASKPEQK